MFNPCRHVGGWGWGGDLNVGLRVRSAVAHFFSAPRSPFSSLHPERLHASLVGSRDL